MNKKETKVVCPSLEELRAELEQTEKRAHRRSTILGAFYTVVTVILIIAIASHFWAPVLIVTGESMEPVFSENDALIIKKNAEISRGSLVAFYYGNKLLVKRCVAVAGDNVKIDDEGTVFINDEPLDEPYAINKCLGECSTDIPGTVPEGRFFVLSDNRPASFDSRDAQIGYVDKEQILGVVSFRAWPLDRFGSIEK